MREFPLQEREAAEAARDELEDAVEAAIAVEPPPTCDATEDRCWKELGERNQELLDAHTLIERLKDVLTAAHHTLSVHGHIDADTELHERIRLGISAF
jgi:hypothetical protein